MAWTSYQIGYLIATIINILILIPISLYYLYKLWILRKKPLLSKRHTKLVVLFVIILIVNGGFIRVIADIYYIVPSDYYSKNYLYFLIFIYNTFHIHVAIYYCRLWFL